jgi:hypothetical protein
VVERNIMLWLPRVTHGTKQVYKVLADCFVTDFTQTNQVFGKWLQSHQLGQCKKFICSVTQMTQGKIFQ